MSDTKGVQLSVRQKDKLNYLVATTGTRTQTSSMGSSNSTLELLSHIYIVASIMCTTIYKYIIYVRYRYSQETSLSSMA